MLGWNRIMGRNLDSNLWNFCKWDTDEIKYPIFFANIKIQLEDIGIQI
jgi:hypothetical protein